MSDRLLPNAPLNVCELEIMHEPLDAGVVLDGSPHTGVAALTELDMVEIGVWEMSEGAARDVEVDEVFVVISGRATVEVVGGPTYALSAGDIVRLSAGDHTKWTVHELLRKVYVALG